MLNRQTHRQKDHTTCNNGSNNTHTRTQTFKGLYSRTTSVGQYQKDKPFWILLKQEMMEWQWHQLNHMQIICTSLQTDNMPAPHHSIFLQARCPACHPTNSVKALKAVMQAITHCNIKLLPLPNIMHLKGGKLMTKCMCVQCIRKKLMQSLVTSLAMTAIHTAILQC